MYIKKQQPAYLQNIVQIKIFKSTLIIIVALINIQIVYLKIKLLINFEISAINLSWVKIRFSVSRCHYFGFQPLSFRFNSFMYVFGRLTHIYKSSPTLERFWFQGARKHNVRFCFRKATYSKDFTKLWHRKNENVNSNSNLFWKHLILMDSKNQLLLFWG